jgi:sterol desaturase/sphingolipid hydroxylase (fatty acid hydroxylase superfamily)
MPGMELHPPLLKLALPVLLAFAMLEALWIVRRQRKSYPWRQTGVTLLLALGQRLVGALFAGGVLWVMVAISDYRLWTIAMDNAWAWLALFVGVEFFYYWFHRASHECRWFWATHVVHHTPERMVLSGALRLGWTGPLSGAFGFYIPLVLIGFPPQSVFIVLAGNLLYQFWLHTEMLPKLGWLEWLFNTPSHHRVHHARNPHYLDANYGGVLIVFDRLFGSFVAEDDAVPCDYGLVKPIGSDNVFRIAFGEWVAIARDLSAAKNWQQRLGFLFAAPGWQPDGNGLTTENIRGKKPVIQRELTFL